MNLQQEILDIVANVLQLPAKDIDPAGRFFEDYGVDSLRALEILAEVENTYHITLDPENLMKMTCVNEVVRLTREALGDDEN